MELRAARAAGEQNRILLSSAAPESSGRSPSKEGSERGVDVYEEHHRESRQKARTRSAAGSISNDRACALALGVSSNSFSSNHDAAAMDFDRSGRNGRRTKLARFRFQPSRFTKWAGRAKRRLQVWIFFCRSVGVPL